MTLTMPPGGIMIPRLKKRRDEAMRLRCLGLTYAQIGSDLGITRQAARQLVAPPRRIRDAVLANADGGCEECGVLVDRITVHIHHRQAKGLTVDACNEIGNLQALCVSCHLRAHARAPKKSA